MQIFVPTRDCLQKASFILWGLGGEDFAKQRQCVCCWVALGTGEDEQEAGCIAEAGGRPWLHGWLQSFLSKKDILDAYDQDQQHFYTMGTSFPKKLFTWQEQYFLICTLNPVFNSEKNLSRLFIDAAVWPLSWVQLFCDPRDCSPPASSIHGISRPEYQTGVPFPSPRKFLI